MASLSIFGLNLFEDAITDEMGEDNLDRFLDRAGVTQTRRCEESGSDYFSLVLPEYFGLKH